MTPAAATRRGAALLAALSAALLAAPAAAGGGERSRHLRVGAAALAVPGLPPLTGVSGEVRTAGRSLSLDGRFELSGGSGECRLSRSSGGDLTLSVSAGGVRLPAPFDGRLAFACAAAGPADDLSGTFEAALEAARLVVAGAGGASAAVELGEGAARGALRLTREGLALEADASLGGCALAAALAGPADRFAERAEGRLTLRAAGLPLPEGHPAALRLGPRLDSLALRVDCLPDAAARAVFAFRSPLAAATGEVTVDRALRTVTGTVEVAADRAAARGALRLGPFDLNVGPALRADLLIEGTLDRPAWRILRWH